MRGLLRWIIVLLLLGVVIFLLINLFNNSKANNKNNSKEPVVYEKADVEPPKVIHQEPVQESVIEEKTIEVGDTADFSSISVYIGVFMIAAGVYILKYKKANI